jgi:hypothetical protein
MQIEKNDFARALDIVKIRDKDKYETVFYRTDRVNKPRDLLFARGENDEHIIRNAIPDFNRYAHVGVKDLLDTLLFIDKKERKEPELPFVDKNSKILDLGSALDERRIAKELQDFKSVKGKKDVNVENKQQENKGKRHKR